MKVNCFVLFCFVFCSNNYFSHDTLIVKKMTGKIHYWGFELGGPGVYGSFNYKSKYIFNDKFSIIPVIGITHTNLYSPDLALPVRVEFNSRISGKCYFTNQVSFTPLFNFFPHPENDSLRKVYVKLKYDDGTFLLRRVEWLYTGSAGITICLKKVDLQVMAMVIAWRPRGVLSEKYSYVPFGQVAVYYKIFK